MGAYLMIGGTAAAPTIKGGVVESTHKDWVSINSWSSSASRPVVSEGGTEKSRHRGEAEVSEIAISKVIDKASPYILQSLLKGDSITTVQLDMTSVESDSKVFVYYTITMSNVRITNYSISGAGDEGSLAQESFNLNCTAIEWKYMEKKADNTDVANHTVAFNLDKVIAAGTLADANQ